MTEVAVVGGGLAGLVTAARLAEAGRDVTLFEREATVGGRVRTTHADGYTMDRGFQVLFTAYPAVRRELDLDGLDLRRFRPGATLVRPGTRSTFTDPFADPVGLPGTVLDRTIPLRDKLRLLALRRRLRRRSVDDILAGADTTIREYLADHGFSQAFRERFAAPFYGGVTLDRSLSTSSVVFEYTFKMLAEGAIAVPAAGMGAIPAQLADRARAAGVTVETETPVRDLVPDGDGVTVDTGGETLSAAATVVATDPATARDLTGVSAIPTGGRGCVTQHFALPTTQSFHVRHELLANAADGRPNTVALMSDAAPEYAPAGSQCLSATFLGSGDESDEALASTVRSALASWFPENRFEGLELLRTDRIEMALPPQAPGFRQRAPRIGAPEGPVVLAGDYTRWSSIQGALESGRQAAAAVLEP